MIAVLPYHLTQHVGGVVGERRRVGYVIYDRDLFPQYQPETISGRKHGRVLRIVSEPDEVKAIVLDEFHVADMEGIRQGVSESFEVLMAVRPAQCERFAVQNKALFGVEFEPSKAEGLGHLVHFTPSFLNGRPDAVEIWFIGRPKPRSRDGWGFIRKRRLVPRFDEDFRRCGRDGPAVRIED